MKRELPVIRVQNVAARPSPWDLELALPRALRNAIERKAVEDALCVEPTGHGLCN